MKLVSKKNIIISLTLFLLLASSFLIVNGQTYIDWDGSTDDIENLPGLSVQEIIGNIIDYSAGLVGLISVLVIIIAGIMWAISQGDEEKVKKARQWILAGVIGATIALAAWSITEVVIQGFLSD